MRTTTRIIDLAEPGAGDRLPAFAAVDGLYPENPFVLSPEVMHWRGRIFLCRLDRCRQFWLAQKKKRRVTLGTLFDPLLRHHCGDDFTAVLGDHPWPCLLLLHDRLAHDAPGLHRLDGRLNRSIYGALDWNAWFEPLEELAAQLEAVAARGFEPQRFRARQTQFRRFIERIAVASPRDLRAADGHAIARRFGRWLGRVWRWSRAEGGDLDGFPWRSFAPAPPPAVRRDLDFPVNDWDTTATLLREDCARLCAGLARDDGHVIRMRWQITLYNQSRVDVDLSFRHPYSLQRDAPAFATALYQARYAYDDVMRRLASRATDLDLPEQIPFVAWRLELSERLTLTPQCLDLFAGDATEVDFDRVRQLQNKLPRSLECYRGQASFLAEDAFRRAPIGDPRDEPFALGAWTGSAVNKPLFRYPEAQAIDGAPRGRAVFVERGTSPWWHGDDADKAIRDYFILRDERGRASWAYRDAGGAWYRLGEFC